MRANNNNALKKRMRFVNIMWSAALYIGTCAILYNRRWAEIREARRFKGSGKTGTKEKKKRVESVEKTKESFIKVDPLPTIPEEKPDVEFKAKMEPVTPMKSARPRVLPNTGKAKAPEVDFQS